MVMIQSDQVKQKQKNTIKELERKQPRFKGEQEACLNKKEKSFVG